MRHVGRVLPRAVENAEVLRAARAGAVLRRWVEVVGELLASKSVPDRYDKGTVWVATKSSEWAQELRMRMPQILERMEAMAGERGMFLDVRFGVRPAKSEVFEPEEDVLALPSEPTEPLTSAARISRSLRERPAVPPPPVPEEPKPPEETGLTIRERAARRLQNWPKDSP